jgi:hypothetical protein
MGLTAATSERTVGDMLPPDDDDDAADDDDDVSSC